MQFPRRGFYLWSSGNLSIDRLTHKKWIFIKVHIFARVKKGALLSFFVIIVSLGSFAQVRKSEKKKKLRELSPDRPHQTESPITVDVGHIMFETDLVND